MIFSAVICTNCGFLTSMIQQGMTDDLEIEGIYSGTFTVTYNFAKRTGTTTLKLENGKFTCAGNLDRIPAGGSGNYSINHDKIVFSDKNFWSADFDWNLILKGEYEYTFDGKRLKISANKNNVGYYEYDLEKE